MEDMKSNTVLILTLPLVIHSLETDSRRDDSCLAAAVPSTSASISLLSRMSLSCVLSCLKG